MAKRTTSPYELKPVDEVYNIIREVTARLERCTEQVDILHTSALGFVLAEDVLASDHLPPFPASIKDGYAVVASDGLGTFPLAGEVRAGGSGVTISPGNVAYITTGAPVPDGADAVIQIEDTERVPGASEVTIKKAAKAGQDIRTVGSDIEKGQLCLEAGTLLGPAEIGILATVGATKVQVYSKPAVTVVSTGDEVVDADTQQLGPGQIRDSNRSMLVAAVQATGCHAEDAGIISDDAQRLERLLDECATGRARVIISSGGVSMGDRDLVKPLLERRGTVYCGRVLMKPGKPLTVATLDVGGRAILFFGLPGNPVSSIVCYHLFVRNALRMLMGHPVAEPQRVHAVLQSEIKLDQERPEYHRVRLTWQKPQEGCHGQFLAESTGVQRSSRLLSVRSTVGLLELPQGSANTPVLRKGAAVPCILIEDLREMTL